MGPVLAGASPSTSSPKPWRRRKRTSRVERSPGSQPTPKRRRRNMVEQSNAPTSSTQQELVIERIFDAPRALVWKAWTDPEMATKWWGPKGFTCPHCEIDLRVGGKDLNFMRGPP